MSTKKYHLFFNDFECLRNVKDECHGPIKHEHFIVLPLSMSGSNQPPPLKKANTQTQLEQPAKFNPIILINNDPIMEYLKQSLDEFTKQYRAVSAEIPQLQNKIEEWIAVRDAWQGNVDMYEYTHDDTITDFNQMCNENIYSLSIEKEAKLLEMKKLKYLRYAIAILHKRKQR